MIDLLVQGARTHLEKITAAAQARQAATLNPAMAVTPKQKPSKPKRHVSMGAVMDAETGEVIEGSSTGEHTPSGAPASGKRQSKRTHTMLSTSAHVNRMRDAVKKVSIETGIRIIPFLLFLLDVPSFTGVASNDHTCHRSKLPFQRSRRSKPRLLHKMSLLHVL